MAITRAGVETVLTARTGALLREADMACEAGANPHLSDPIAWAMRALGYGVGSLATVTDADLQAVAPHHIDALLDLAELRTLESVGGNLAAVDVTVGPVSERRSSLGPRVDKLIETKRAAVQARWGGVLREPLAEAGGNVSLLAL